MRENRRLIWFDYSIPPWHISSHFTAPCGGFFRRILEDFVAFQCVSTPGSSARNRLPVGSVQLMNNWKIDSPNIETGWACPVEKPRLYLHNVRWCLAAVRCGVDSTDPFFHFDAARATGSFEHTEEDYVICSSVWRVVDWLGDCWLDALHHMPSWPCA